MSILVVGLNHRCASLAIRETVAVSVDEKADLCVRLLEEGADEAVVLSTCNRTELILNAENVDSVATSARDILLSRISEKHREKHLESEVNIFVLQNTEAVRHLFEVASGIDSAVVGEPHILGQIRDDLNQAVRAGSVGKALRRLFVHAVFLAKSVRQNTELGRANVSVSSIALDTAGRIFGDIAQKNLLVLGGGEMGRQTAILAANKGAKITVSARTYSRSQEIAQKVNGVVIPWESRINALINSDIVVSCTGATSPIIERADMVKVMHERRGKRIFIIDIAVPRDVDPAVDDLYNLYRYDLDDLTAAAAENTARRQSEIPKVRAMIESALTEFDKCQLECNVVPDIVALREKVEQIRKTETENFLRKMHSLDDKDRNLVEAMSLALTNKILHRPTVRLKESALHGTDRRHVASLRYLFGLDLEEGNDISDEDI